MIVAELAGRGLGVLLAPLIWLAGRIKRSRPIHSDGLVLRADVRAHAEAKREPGLLRFAQALAGPGQARLSGTMKGADDERAEVIGLGLRFGAAGTQDLLLATFDGFAPAQLKRALATTNTRDYLANSYRSVARWWLVDVGEVTLRAVGAGDGEAGAELTRRQRLERAMAAGTATLVLEVKREGQLEWMPVADIALTGYSSVPSASLRLSFSRDGAGLHAVGFLAGLRKVVYAVAQRAGRAPSA